MRFEAGSQHQACCNRRSVLPCYVRLQPSHALRTRRSCLPSAHLESHGGRLGVRQIPPCPACQPEAAPQLLDLTFNLFLESGVEADAHKVADDVEPKVGAAGRQRCGRWRTPSKPLAARWQQRDWEAWGGGSQGCATWGWSWREERGTGGPTYYLNTASDKKVMVRQVLGERLEPPPPVEGSDC